MTAHADLRELAEACAKLGGSILMEARGRGPGEIREKARNDFVTEVDAASEAAITALLRERVPGHAILAEEGATGGVARPDAPAQADSAAAGSDAGTWGGSGIERESVRGNDGAIGWIVDPLDGTKNYIHGFPVYAVSVAARGPEGILAGAVYDPSRDELFSAARGMGATLNGRPIRVSSGVEPGRALVGTGFPFRHSRLSEPYLESFRRVTSAVSDVRRAGSASLDLAYVACGRLDGFWELALSPWDIAAGWLLIEEAGGHVTDEQGGKRVFERGHVVAGGAEIHALLLEISRATLVGRVEAFTRVSPAP